MGREGEREGGKDERERCDYANATTATKEATSRQL